MTSTSDWHTVTLEIPFFSHKHALIAKQSIEVDQELQPQSVHRTLTVADGSPVLVATFNTLTVRLARLVVNSFLENVDLVVRTLEQFADDADRASPTRP